MRSTGRHPAAAVEIRRWQSAVAAGAAAGLRLARRAAAITSPLWRTPGARGRQWPSGRLFLPALWTRDRRAARLRTASGVFMSPATSRASRRCWRRLKSATGESAGAFAAGAAHRPCRRQCLVESARGRPCRRIQLANPAGRCLVRLSNISAGGLPIPGTSGISAAGNQADPLRDADACPRTLTPHSIIQRACVGDLIAEPLHVHRPAQRADQGPR